MSFPEAALGVSSFSYTSDPWQRKGEFERWLGRNIKDEEERLKMKNSKALNRLLALPDSDDEEGERLDEICPLPHTGSLLKGSLVLIMAKPNAVAEKKVGKIITAYEKGGWIMVKTKLVQKVARETAEQHYKEHAEKAFFEQLIQFTCSGPTIVMVFDKLEPHDNRDYEHTADYKQAREIQTSLRAKFLKSSAASGPANYVHCSANQEEARQELLLWFDVC